MGIRWPGSLFVGYTRRPLARCQPPDTHSLRPCQQPPSRHVQIRQTAADTPPGGAESPRAVCCRRPRPTLTAPGRAPSPAIPDCHARSPPWPPPNESAWSGYPHRHDSPSHQPRACSTLTVLLQRPMYRGYCLTSGTPLSAQKHPGHPLLRVCNGPDSNEYVSGL